MSNSERVGAITIQIRHLSLSMLAFCGVIAFSWTGFEVTSGSLDAEVSRILSSGMFGNRSKDDRRGSRNEDFYYGVHRKLIAQSQISAPQIDEILDMLSSFVAIDPDTTISEWNHHWQHDLLSTKLDRLWDREQFRKYRYLKWKNPIQINQFIEVWENLAIQRTYYLPESLLPNAANQSVLCLKTGEGAQEMYHAGLLNDKTYAEKLKHDVEGRKFRPHRVSFASLPASRSNPGHSMNSCTRALGGFEFENADALVAYSLMSHDRVFGLVIFMPIYTKEYSHTPQEDLSIILDIETGPIEQIFPHLSLASEKFGETAIVNIETRELEGKLRTEDAVTAFGVSVAKEYILYWGDLVLLIILIFLRGQFMELVKYASSVSDHALWIGFYSADNISANVSRMLMTIVPIVTLVTSTVVIRPSALVCIYKSILLLLVVMCIVDIWKRIIRIDRHSALAPRAPGHSEG